MMEPSDQKPDKDTEQRAGILLVDDEPMVLKMLQTFLSAQGFNVICAPDARTAIAILKQQRNTPDLLITDIRMPDMNGIQLLTAAHQLLPELPVLLMTGYTDFELVVDGLKQHAFDLLFKPIDFEQLNWCISRALAFQMNRRIEQRYRKRLEEQVAKQTALLCKQLEDLHEAQRKASEVDDLKRSFLNLISHEFRTPLNGIVGSIELLEHEGLPASQRELLAMLKISSQRMTSLVSNLLTLAEAQAFPPLQTAAQSPCTVIKALKERYQRKADDKGITLNTCCMTPPELFLQGPWDVFHIIVGILLDNAFKYTGRGGKVSCNFRVESDPALPEQTTGVVQVCDTGPGIAPSHQETIFQPFTQIDHYLTRKTDGIGIGLAIVRTMCEKSGGTVTLESSQDTGSCFTCSLPFCDCQMEPVP